VRIGNSNAILPQSHRERTPGVAWREPRGCAWDLRADAQACTQQHPEGLTAVEIKVHLGVEQPIGDTLAGMIRNQLVAKQGSGQAVRYTVRG
jgi:hypothetical protein